MVKSSAMLTLLAPLFLLFIGALAGPCMPCQAANRRNTPRRNAILSLRGLHSPKITNPTNGTEWSVGSDVAVTWDVRDMPDKTSNAKGTIVLGYITDGSPDLDFQNPLATGFNMTTGVVVFNCPKVDARKDYIISLYLSDGDSASRSPAFTIKH